MPSDAELARALHRELAGCRNLSPKHVVADSSCSSGTSKPRDTVQIDVQIDTGHLRSDSPVVPHEKTRSGLGEFSTVQEIEAHTKGYWIQKREEEPLPSKCHQDPKVKVRKTVSFAAMPNIRLIANRAQQVHAPATVRDWEERLVGFEVKLPGKTWADCALDTETIK